MLKKSLFAIGLGLIILLFIVSSEISIIESAKRDIKNAYTICKDDKCTYVSEIQYVYEDDIWKNKEDAKSLKGSGIDCSVIYDGVHKAECLDWNWTHKQVKLELADSKELSKDIPIKNYNINNQLTKEENINFKSLTDKYEQWIESNINDELHFGESSTIITLDYTNSDCLADTYIAEANPTTNYISASTLYSQDVANDLKYILMKWNISGIPDEKLITSAELQIDLYDNKLDNSGEGWDQDIHHLYDNSSWNPNTVTYNTKPIIGYYNLTPADSINIYGGTGEPEDWQYFNVTSILNSREGLNDISFYILSSNRIGTPSTTSDDLLWRSTESSGPSARPILNVTYTDAPPVVSPYDCILPSINENWIVDTGLHCNLTTDLDMGQGNITILDYLGIDGYFNISADLNITNIDEISGGGHIITNGYKLLTIK